MPQNHLQEHIELIARYEQEFLKRRSRAERITDAVAAFAGNPRFVLAHLILFVVWIGLNTLPQLHHFDPSPFSLFATIITLEAILLASVILMRQTRLGRRADERDHLMLQILLLTEKELTAVVAMNRQIARQVGLENIADRPDIKEFSRHTAIDDVVQTIKDAIPPPE
jgi:uncharacterized membrane protein